MCSNLEELRGVQMKKGPVTELVSRQSIFRIAVFLAVLIFPANTITASLPDSMLHDAIGQGDVKGVVEALQAGADPSSLLEETALSAIEMAADIPLFLHDGKEIEKLALEILKLLFEAGARISKKDSTILHCAVIKGSAAILEFLISKGANLNAEDGEGNSPLSLAIETEHPEIVEALLRHGARPMTEPEIAQIRFVSAATKGNISNMSELLSKGVKIDGKTRSGKTALVAAARAQQEESVKWLLTKGADANLYAKEGPLEAPPLWNAMLCNRSLFNFSIPLLLLRHGASANATDPYLKQTPLHVAAWLDNLLAVAILLNAGSDVKAQDAEGKTPLDYAEDIEIINLLKASGAVERR
jgi:ankyrin repeat protein